MFTSILEFIVFGVSYSFGVEMNFVIAFTATFDLIH